MTITVIRPTRISGAGPTPRYTCLGKQDPNCLATWHGTYSAYNFGCRCPHAREAKRIYHKRLREQRHTSHYTDSTGTRRRLQALIAIGWRWQDMAEHLGTSFQNVQTLGCTGTGRVMVTTAARVRALYNRLSTTPGPSEISRRRATRAGWAPPLAWDNIDDPDEQPNLGDTNRGDGYDEITVGLAVDGRLTYAQIAVHRPDLIETVRRLAKTLTDIEIAHLLRWPGANEARKSGSTKATNSITKLRHDKGIPACTRPASIAPRVRHRTAQAA